MKQQKFNQGWKVFSGIADPFAAIYGGPPATRPVILPSDEMILEERNPECTSGTQSGYYPAKTYTYTKKFHAPEEWQDGQQYLEFEGVMSKAMVYVNNQFAGSHSYGYSQFFINLKPYLKYGKENQIRVVAVNQEQSSRWYSGSGIYRDVNLLTGGAVHIAPEGIRLTTEDVEDDYAVISLDIQLESLEQQPRKVLVKAEFLDAEENTAAQDIATVTVREAGESTLLHMRMYVNDPKLWSPDAPHLYHCRIQVLENDVCVDSAAEEFGIRTLQLDARKGLRINGKTVKLRGCCIHHDNGILGAATLYQAEEFRAKQLKAAGFNSIRSAHHPMSKAMLRACDRLGILVMDELSDMWNVPKNSHDFSLDFAKSWEEEVERMVSKDYNHPCVILYSCGNEIPEISGTDGADLNRRISNLLHKLDPVRYTTCGINGLLAAGDGLVEYMMSIGLDPTQAVADTPIANVEEEDRETSGGSEALNAAMADMQKQMLEAFLSNDFLTQRLEEVSCGLDASGFNYMTIRHELEHKEHPNRVVVGSETYPSEIASLWEIVERNPHVIGDFTWTGYDYIGEAGIGIFHYETEQKKQGFYPDRLAYCGDININGYRRPASYLREIAYGLRKEPFIAVEAPEHYGKQYDRNDWKYCDGTDSWTYRGQEGKPVRIRVLANADEAELFVNGSSKGKKKIGEQEKLTAFFDCEYEPGTLEAICYTNGQESGRKALVTAGEPAGLKVEVHNSVLKADGSGVSFLTVETVDKNGIVNRQAKTRMSVSVEGAGYLAGFGNANPSSVGSYQQEQAETFDGRVMAAVRSTDEAGMIKVTFRAEGCGEQIVTIKAE